jgi:betaine reductase
VLVTAIPQLAESIGANRIVRGRAVGYPFGDPSLVEGDERRFRRRLVECALAALETAVTEPTVFEVA